MRIAPPPLGALLSGLWRASHPGPSVVVTLVALTLGIATSLEPWRIAVLTVTVLLGQLSIGLSNDAIDAPRDRAVGRADKPVARGSVSVRAAWVAAGAAVLVGLALSFALSWQMALAHAIALASAWSYNAGLKSTPVSVMPFLVTFGLLPSLVTLSASEPRVAAGWAWAAGASLGVAIHLTNVLPDLDEDARTGVRGLPHRVGRRASAVIAALAVAGGALAVLLGPDARTGIFAVLVFGGVIALGLAGLILALVRPPGRWVFRIVMLAALLLCAQLALAGTGLSA